MKKKLFALCLALTLILGILAGCGSAPEEPSAAPEEAPTETPAAPEEAPPEEPSEEEPASDEIVHLIDFPIDHDFEVTVSMSTTPSLTNSGILGPTPGDDLGWVHWLSERTGAEITVDLYSFLDENTKQSLMIATGDFTDIIMGSLQYSGGVDTAVNDEVLTDISQYAEYMPDYMNVLFKNPDNVALAYSTGFHLTAFYGINDPEAKSDYGPVMRKDWLEALDLDVPETYDDWHEVLTAFKNEYNATLWITSFGGVPGNLAGGYGACEYAGGPADPTWSEDGEFKHAVLSDGYKKYLRMMNQWYQEGLIYSDFISSGGSDYPDNSLFTTDRIGVWFDYTANLEKDQMLLEPETTGAYITPVPWPTEKAGEFNPQTYTKLPNNAGIDGMGGFSVTTASEDIPLLCAIINEFYTEEGHEFANWGIEGEHYTIEPDGSHKFTDLILKDEYGLGPNIAMTIYFFKDGPFEYDSDRFLASYSDMQLEAAEMWTSGAGNIAASNLDADQSLAYFMAQSDVNTVYQEYTAKFIIGEKSIDNDWDEYIGKLTNAGLDTILELGQLGVDQYFERYEDVLTLVDEYFAGK